MKQLQTVHDCIKRFGFYYFGKTSENEITIRDMNQSCFTKKILLHLVILQ